MIRLHSPVGWNAHHCVSTVGASTNVGRVFRAWYAHNDAWMTESDRGKLNLIAELLSIKHHYCSLELLNADEVDAAI